MRWTSMELAAMATAAVPGLSPTGVAAVADDARDFTSAIVVDVDGGRWRVRSPQHQEAAMRLETELQVLRGFSTGIRAELPFRLPSVAGAVRRGELRTFVYNHLPGEPLELEELNRGSAELVDDVGRTIAAIHDLDEHVVDDADLPRYSAERFRQRRLNELDQAATTGQIPATLLRRWEHAMEEKELWNFTPTVTHGDLHEDSLLIDDQRVVAVTGWTDLHIGDPAGDFAWLTASPDAEFSEAVLAAYRSHRRGDSDPHLMRRAALSAEFALAQWLVRGHATENQDMVDEARELLRQLEEDILAHGGQPIALTPMDQGMPQAPAQVSSTSSDEQASQPVARAGAAATVADTGEWAESGDGDAEPAVITDATAEEATAEEAAAETASETAGQAPEMPADEPSGPSADASQPPEELPTGEFPAVADDAAPSSSDTAFQDDQPTGSFPAVREEPTTGELPIAPDEAADDRARQKHYFPPRSVEEHAAHEAYAEDAGPAEETVERAEADEAPEPEHDAEPAPSSAQPSRLTETSDSIYSAFPGLRPPQS